MWEVARLIEIAFWVCTLGVIYVYAFYPILVFVLSRVLGRTSDARPMSDEQLPDVTVLIAARNEEAVIDDRIRNALALDYPKNKLEIIIASDGSTDQTNQIVEQYADRGVKLIDHRIWQGKAAVLNQAMRDIRSDIVIFSDANTYTEPGAARALVRWFADPQVGVVCGRLRISDPNVGNNVDGAYWKYETFLKKCEGRLGALLGSNGAIYAIRADQYVPIPNNTIIDDFIIPLQARLKYGSRIVYDSSAVAHEESAPNIRNEVRRRSRIGAGGWQATALLWRLLNPANGWIAFTFLSHKVLRWICPFLLIGALLTNFLLCAVHPYGELFLTQLALYATALIGLAIPGQSKAAKLAHLPSMFVSMNAALFMGFLRWAQGSQTGMWARTHRLKEVYAAASAQLAEAAASRWRALNAWDVGVIAVVVCGAVFALSDTWQSIFTLSYVDEELSYVMLAPVVMVWLAWIRWDSLKGSTARPAWFGLPVLVFGWLVHWYGFNYDPAVWRAGAVIVAVGAFMTAAGRDVCIRLAPALVAAVFLIPIDPNGRFRIAGPLEVVTAQATQSVCEILGMSVERSGNLLTVGGTAVDIAEACNGMRMIISLMLVCYVVAFTFPFKAGVRVMLLSTSPLVAIVANVVRLVPTVWTFGHESLATAERFHSISGWVMTVLAFMFLMGLTYVFGKLWDAVAAIELPPLDAGADRLGGIASVRIGS